MNKLTSLVLYTCGNCTTTHATFSASFATAPEAYTQIGEIHEGEDHYENIAEMLLRGDSHMVSAYLKGVEAQKEYAKPKAKPTVKVDDKGIISGVGVVASIIGSKAGPSSEINSEHDMNIRPCPKTASPTETIAHYQAETIRIHLAMDIESHKSLIK